MDIIDLREGTLISAENLDSIIHHELVITYFQPIISLKNRLLMGFEALSRGFDIQGNKEIPPNVLFSSARRENKAVEVDRLCREKAIQQFGRMKASDRDGHSSLLFLNFDASLLDRGVAGSGFLGKQVSRLNIPPNRIVIEIVENQVKDINALKGFIQNYREQGFIIALDDVGAGYSNFDRITIIKPDIIKIDRSIISDINHDYYKQEIFKALVRLSRKTGTLVLAEGVETIEECLYVLDYDADLLQGYFFARPSYPENISLSRIRNIAEHSANQFRGYKINKINRISGQYRSYQAIVEDIKSALYKNPLDCFEKILKTMIEQLSSIEAVYVLDENGIMITDTILRESGKGKANMLFRKAGRGDDLSLKEYFYLLLFTGLQNYVTVSYVSWATGTLTRTLSTSFKGSLGETYVLCLDVLAGSTNDGQIP